jgi:hypothetical protein
VLGALSFLAAEVSALFSPFSVMVALLRLEHNQAYR